MSLTYPNVTPSMMELTPMQVSFQSPGATDFTDLGGTLDNVVLAAKYMKAEIKADQFGETVLDRRVSGIEVTVTTALAEVQNKDIMKVLYPHATKGGTGPSDAAYLDFKTAIGDGDLSNAGILKLHPLSKDPTDLSEDLYFWKACASAESEITYGPTEQSKAKIVWNILPDTSVSPARFFRYGDHTL